MIQIHHERSKISRSIAVSQTVANHWHVLTVPSYTPILEYTPLHIKILVVVAVNVRDCSSMVFGRVTV